MQLNCDMGEGAPELDTLLMPHIDMASIACGGHTGDNSSMNHTVALAQQHNVAIGAHPSYPDKANFGRIQIEITSDALFESLYKQVNDLQGICQQHQTTLQYIKPHGALYNAAAHDLDLYRVLAKLAEDFGLPLIIPTFSTTHARLTHNAPDIIYEAFADRAYSDEGSLVPRTQEGAVHGTIEKVVAQAQSITTQQGLYSISGKWQSIHADTLCVHSDSPSALAGIKAIREHLEKH